MKTVNKCKSDCQSVNLPILTYHKILPEKEIDCITPKRDRLYTFSRDEFEKHCVFLNSNGYSTLSFHDLKEIIQNQQQPSANPVILTFDDGHESNYSHALPILQSYGLKATFFIITDLVGKQGYLNWKKITEMYESGMEIQSHTHTHPNVSELDELEVTAELTISKKLIEDHIKTDVFVLALPGGLYNNLLKRVAISSGYSFICTSKWGHNKISCDIFLLKRFPIKLGDRFSKYRLFLEEKRIPLFLLTIKKNTIVFARKVIGETFYRHIRNTILK